MERPIINTSLSVLDLAFRLREVSRLAQEDGFILQPGELGLTEWNNHYWLDKTTKKCCPLGALLHGHKLRFFDKTKQDELFEACYEAAGQLGTHVAFTIGVMQGFDGEMNVLLRESRAASVMAGNDIEFQIGHQIGEWLRVTFCGPGPTRKELLAARLGVSLDEMVDEN